MDQIKKIVRREMDLRGVNQFQLSRIIDPKKPERARRALYRWFLPKTPHGPSIKFAEECLAALKLNIRV